MSNLTAKIGPSILNADLSSLADESRRLVASGADYLHLDVMDGHFVPNLTFGHPMVTCLRKAIVRTVPFDMHMMVSEPQRWIEPMADSLESRTNQYTSQYTFHLEALNSEQEVKDCIRHVKEAGMRVGVAIKPNTPVEAVLPYVPQVDCVLIMTVEPGFGGQKFMSNMMAKVQRLRQTYRELDIEVDGGVGPATINECASAGANMIVSGTAVIGAQNPRQVMQHMRDAVSDAIQRSQLER